MTSNRLKQNKMKFSNRGKSITKETDKTNGISFNFFFLNSNTDAQQSLVYTSIFDVKKICRAENIGLIMNNSHDHAISTLQRSID